MENVPQILSEQNKHDFGEWRESLRNMGYTNDFRLLNAKDYGIPQNRERCFMVSWLGEYTYEFPEPIELKLTLRDVLEKDVDESYYLSPAETDTFRPEEGGGMGWNCFKQNREQNATAQNL
jgi:DNA (cytosine-5)-methyltransferase 1